MQSAPETPGAAERHPLPYQPRVDRKLPHSRFGVIAVGALLIAFALFFVFLNRRPILVFPGFIFAWLIGIFSTAAAYARRRVCSLTLAHLGLLLIVVDFLLTTRLPSI